MNKQSLSALIKLHNAIAKDELAFETILDLIADRARIVANATGIAIGLLTGDQLVYRAGSGSGAQYVGRRVTAVLSVSAHTGPRKEILRVDNADSDPRIEATICRECDAKALLIIPICRNRILAGVLEVIFSDAHTFDDREVRTYRMMGTLVEEAMARNLQLRQKGALTTETKATQASVGKVSSERAEICSDDNRTSEPLVVQVCGAPATVPGTIPTIRPSAEEVTTVKWPLKWTFFHDPRWTLGAAAAVILLGAAGWISLHQRAASTMEGGARIEKPNASEKRAPRATVNKWLNAASGTQYTNSARPRFARVRVGPNEVDYIAEDVTIRHFTKPVRATHTPSAYEQFEIGDDVTVRIFNHKPEVLPANSLRQQKRNP